MVKPLKKLLLANTSICLGSKSPARNKNGTHYDINWALIMNDVVLWFILFAQLSYDTVVL